MYIITLQQEGQENVQDKIATELLDREQKIVKLQHIIEDLRENEKLMLAEPFAGFFNNLNIFHQICNILYYKYRENSMTQYENQLASLRLEVKRLRNYDCYAKEIPYPEIETEVRSFQFVLLNYLASYIYIWDIGYSCSICICKWRR